MKTIYLNKSCIYNLYYKKYNITQKNPFIFWAETRDSPWMLKAKKYRPKVSKTKIFTKYLNKIFNKFKITIKDIIRNNI